MKRVAAKFFFPMVLIAPVVLLLNTVASAQYQNQFGNRGPQFGGGMAPHAGPPGGPLPETVPVSDSTLRIQRWQNEWKEQHPGEPVPNLGQLEHMHSAETNALVRQGGQQMWANRQSELKRNYLMAKNIQQQRNEANHVTWGPQQWAAWDKQYDAGQQAQANAYLEAVRQSGEMARAEAFYKQNGYYPR
jgi:hypothetical protein